MEYTAKSIAELLSGQVVGNPNCKVTTISKIEEAQKGSLTFLANPAYANFLITTKASIVLITKEFIPKKKIDPTLIVVEDSYKAFATLVEIYHKFKSVELSGIEEFSFIHKEAIIGSDVYIGSFSYISANAIIGDNVKIYPQVFIGENVEIGENTSIHPGVKIYQDCKIERNCIIHSGTIIGSDGFGFAPQKDGTFLKIQQIGNVVIEENVEIGANNTIDRATIGSTVIKAGAKLDNLIQIAHNVEIGNNTVIASQAGIAGSTKVGKNCLIGGQAGFVGHIKIADKTNIGAQAGVAKSITKEQSTVMGAPAFDLIKFHRSYSVFKNLPGLRNEVIDLKKQIQELKELIKGSNNE
ncbi:MAG: UDP-3-O-(3-hydroxymyristoyl)glucosamine N-acyltransferase [Bacteroidales bacterium]|nr:UDP-3-O-(3-hydroxymyristoyl)glucosamine N-acyltransferase [Bacteroidales bacterium]